MIEDSKKLEELIYLSLIGEFDYVHENNYGKNICFTAQNLTLDRMLDRKNKPLFITSENIVSDKIALARLNAFENKIFEKSYLNNLPKNELNYSKRIKNYIRYVEKENKQNETLKCFYNNTLFLNAEQIISATDLFAAQEFVISQFKNEKQLSK